MYKVVHVMIGFSIGLLVGGSSLYSLLYGIAGAFGAYFPDIGHPPGRRKRSTHNIVFPILFLIIIYSAYMIIKLNNNDPILIFITGIIAKSLYAFFISWLVHVLNDSLSVGGVYPLWPFSNKRVRITRLKSNSLALNLFGLFLAFIMLYLWLVLSGLNKFLEDIVKNLLRSLS